MTSRFSSKNKEKKKAKRKIVLTKIKEEGIRKQKTALRESNPVYLHVQATT